MEETKKRIQEIEDQIEQLIEEQETLNQVIYQAIINSILDSGALSEFVWSAYLSHSIIPLRRSDYEHSLLTEYQKDFHCHYKLAKGIFLFYDDYEVRITYDSIEDFYKFVNTYGINISTVSLSNTIQAKLDEVSSYTKVMKILDNTLMCSCCFGRGTTTQYDDGPEETRNTCPCCNGSGLTGD